MNGLRFQWHDGKAESNQRKHRVTFAEAMTAFVDEWAVEAADEKHSDQEQRYVLIGFSERLRFLTVVYTLRDEEKTIHIISARRSSRTEEACYVSANRGASSERDE